MPQYIDDGLTASQRYYRRHRKARIAAATRYWKQHREERNTYQRIQKRRRYREDALYRTKILVKSKEQYRKHHARYLVRNAKIAQDWRQKARLRLWYAVKTGRIQKPARCDTCKKPGYVEGHHYRGYKYPFDVVWLCKLCHGQVHWR